MEYDYNRIFLENRQITNKTSLIWMQIMAGVVALLWAANLLHLLTFSTWVLNYMAPVSLVLLLIPAVINKLFHLSDMKHADKKEILILTASILGCSIAAVFLLSVALSYYMAPAWIFPLLIACQYCSGRLTIATFGAGLIGMLSSFYLSLYVGVWDYNMLAAPALNMTRSITFSIAGHATIYILSRILLYCATLPLFIAVTRKSALLMKKQKLAIIAHQARQTLDNLHEFPDTFTTDCRIKMRYLAKNGIDIDTAVKSMGGNVEKYNDFMLTFVGESHRKEDEMFSLMEPDTLLQYAGKAHTLRVKANALGLKKLTDTAFFHEMEAYAGNMEIVQANWEKLSFEWDEACDIFTDYIQSLGLKDHATDNTGNQITFRQWGRQLQEALDALEAYDTLRARNILKELLQYQIDTDITKNLQAIITNIDEILKA